MGAELEQFRQQADDRLREAWNQGRLDASEHERRTTALRHATSTDEIAAIERGDLRSQGGEFDTGGLSPIPPLDDRGGVVARRDDAGAAAVSRSPERRRGLSPQAYGAISSATPLMAVILFFLLNRYVDEAWVFFLMIPLVWTVLPAFRRRGSDGEDAATERRERRREIKRARRRSRRELGR